MYSLSFRGLLLVGSASFSPGIRKTFSFQRRCLSLSPPKMALTPEATSLSRSSTLNASSGAAGSADCVGGVKEGKGTLCRYENITKSTEDNREYRGLELSNRMKVLVISDPTTDKSAAALSVSVGTMSDPPELPGLAHFCEHMLFLGTDKYPQENKYNKFLSENGGMSNASTHSDQTVYYFDVIPEKLAETLDIFSQFFICPLFTASMTARELNAVDSEHSKNLKSDVWRLMQLNHSTGDPSHPYSNFGSGNKQTLEITPKEKGIDVREELIKFHNKWYSSNIMNLIILGKEPLDELEEMAISMFSGVEDRSAVAPTWPDHPCPPAYLKLQAKIVPVCDQRSLSVSFPIPDTREHYKSAPGHYLSHLLAHEGPGSILSLLKEKGWCNRLYGGVQGGARGFDFFGIQVDLTEEGINHTDDIITLIFQYINLLKKLGPVKWVHEEHSKILAMNFRFKDKDEPRSYVESHVNYLADFPMEDVLIAHYHVTEWRPDLIDEMLGLLTPDNVRVAIVAKAFEPVCNLTEKWYGTKYQLEKIPEETIQMWKSAGLCDALFLPPVNEFIPDSFALHPLEDGAADLEPVIIKDTPYMRVWYKQDNEFFLPKRGLSIEIDSPLAYADPISCNLTTVFTMLFRDALTEYSYAAVLAGFEWSISNTKSGMSLRIESFDSKQHIFLDKLMDRLVNFKVDPRRFEVMKEIHGRSLRNTAADQPYQHGMYHLALLLSETAWTHGELLEASSAMTVEKLEEFIPRLLSTIHIECLVHGNSTKEKALELVSLIEQKLPKSAVPLLPQQLMLAREIQLEKGTHYRLEVDHKVHNSSCTLLYYQCGMQSTQDNVLLELILQIISEPCFDTLRTKEQLGYIVFSGLRRGNGVQGLRIIVQSDKHPKYVEGRIEAFLHHMKTYIAELSDEEFERHRSALAAQRLKKPKMLCSRTHLLWCEISSQQYHFHRTQVEVQALRQLSREQLIDFYEKLIHTSSVERQKIGVHVVSSAEGGAGHPDADKSSSEENANKIENLLPVPEDNTKILMIEDLISFKSGRSLFPHISPYISVPRKGAHCKL